MKLILVLANRSWLKLLTSSVAGLLAGLSYAAIVAIIGRGLRANISSSFLGMELIGACVIHLLMQRISLKMMLELSQETLYRLRLDLCRLILSSSQEKLQTLGNHRLLATLTQDVDSISNAYQSFAGLLSNVVMIGACFLYLGWLSWPSTVAFVMSLTLGMGIVHCLRRGPTREMAETREHLDSLYMHLRNLTDGSRELQLNSRRGDEYIDKVVSECAEAICDRIVRSRLSFSLVANVGKIAYLGGIGTLALFGSYLFYLPQGVLAEVVIVTLFMGPSVTGSMLLLPVFAQANIALDKILRLQEELPETPMEPVLPFPVESPVCLELRGLCHQYGDNGDSNFALGPLDLRIYGGEIVFLIGGNGSGKSTLAMLILGLYRAQAGQILLNGRPLDESSRKQYRQNFSAVLAEFHLFDAISAKYDPRLEERAEGYLRVLNVAHKVKITQGKFSTLGLSSGQRKRLALVSAYLEDRPIYLFDEWAADQDPEFKRLFYTRLLPELKAAGKVVIVITHDDAYFGYADRLISLDEGRIKGVKQN